MTRGAAHAALRKALQALQKEVNVALKLSDWQTNEERDPTTILYFARPPALIPYLHSDTELPKEEDAFSW